MQREWQRVEQGPVDEAGSTELGEEGWGEDGTPVEILRFPSSLRGDAYRRS
jgi:hypothetical protein